MYHVMFIIIVRLLRLSLFFFFHPLFGQMLGVRGYVSSSTIGRITYNLIMYMTIHLVNDW